MKKLGSQGHFTGKKIPSLAQRGPQRGSRGEPSAHERQREASMSGTHTWSVSKPQVMSASAYVSVTRKGMEQLWQSVGEGQGQVCV